jgi:hypothetical protein
VMTMQIPFQERGLEALLQAFKARRIDPGLELAACSCVVSGRKRRKGNGSKRR